MPAIDLVQAFQYHQPSEDQIRRIQQIRERAISLAAAIQTLAPGCPEQTLAIRKVEEASMWANKAIVLEPPGTGEMRPSEP